MSLKRCNLLEDPPSASSSDDEEEVNTSIAEGDEIVGNSSSDEEEDLPSKNPVLKKPEAAIAAITVIAATPKNHVSDTESGSDEETDSDSEPERKNQVLKKLGSSIVQNQDSIKGKTSEKPVTKRSFSEVDGEAASTDVKRVKMVSGEEVNGKTSEGEETKKTYFQRIWSEDDEIAVLQGLIDYKNDTGANPYDDANGFYNSVKKSISFDVTKTKCMEKLRCLKKKYENNVGKKAKNGEEPTLAKPHDRKAFELSKYVWGADGMALEPNVKTNGKLKKSLESKKVESVTVKQELDTCLPNGKNCEDEVSNKGGEEAPSLGVSELGSKFVNSSIVKSLARFGMDEFSTQQGWSRLASDDKRILEEKWKAFYAKEFEFYSEKSGLVHEVMKKIAEAFQSNP